jgi:hypothetical protein
MIASAMSVPVARRRPDFGTLVAGIDMPHHPGHANEKFVRSEHFRNFG